MRVLADYTRWRSVVLTIVLELSTQFPLTIIALADLNTEPREATYQLLINPIRPLGPHLKDELESSRLLHQSVDKAHASVTTTLPASESTEPAAIHGAVASTVGTPDDHNDENDDDDEEGQQGPDTDERSIAGTRPPTASDGLLSVSELIQAFQSASPSRLISAYDIASPTDEPVQTFATRGGFREHADVMQEGNGRNEPAYTCYTPLFRLTLGQSAAVYKQEIADIWQITCSSLSSRARAQPSRNC